MKNTYLTSHFPLFSIVLFSTALALYTEQVLIKALHNLGLYSGMIEFFSENGIKLTLLFLTFLLFFMVFSAMKLIADTMIQLSLLFFSKDQEGTTLNKIRSGSWIYLIVSALAVIFANHIQIIIALFAVATFIYFIFFVYRVSESLTFYSLIGIIFFHILFWFTFILMIIYTALRLYNSIIASLSL